MNVNEAIDIIESCAGFTDESTAAGQAWSTIVLALRSKQLLDEANWTPPPAEISVTLPGREWQNILDSITDAISACMRHGYPGTANMHQRRRQNLAEQLPSSVGGTLGVVPSQESGSNRDEA